MQLFLFKVNVKTKEEQDNLGKFLDNQKDITRWNIERNNTYNITMLLIHCSADVPKKNLQNKIISEGFECELF